MVSSEKESIFKKYFIPTFDELTLFSMSFAVIVLLCISDVFRFELTTYYLRGRGIIFFGIMLVGMAFSIYHVFSSRKKKPIEKWFMYMFILIVNLIVGVLGLYHLMFDLHNHFDVSSAVFPIWNMAYVFYLLILDSKKIISEDSIRNENTPLFRIVISIGLLTAMLLVLQYYFHTYWIVSFSIVLFYLSIVDQIIVFIVKRKKKKKASYVKKRKKSIKYCGKVH